MRGGGGGRNFEAPNNRYSPLDCWYLERAAAQERTRKRTRG